MGRIGRIGVAVWTCAAALALAAVLLLTACNPVALRTYVERMTGFDGAIYVSAAAGSDGNRGVRSEPLQTIQAGIDRAHTYIKEGLADRVEVRVSEGTYRVTNGVEDVGDYIRVVEGVSLYGGYSVDFSSRDPTAYISKIVDVSTAGEDLAAVRAYDGLTPATVIDGFTIQGGSGSGSIGSNALDIERASPTVTNNVILGGYAPAGSCTLALDIYDNASPIVERNTIAGGSCPSANFGVVVSDSSSPVIRYNSITGGSAGNTRGVLCWQTQATFEHNDIDGGEGEVTMGIYLMVNCFVAMRWNTIYGGSASDVSRGIWVCSEMTTIEGNRISGGTSANGSIGVHCQGIPWANIQNNTIYGGTSVSGTANGIQLDGANASIRNNTTAGGASAFSAAVYLQGASYPDIENNILFSLAAPDRYCIYEESHHPSSIRNNNFADLLGGSVMYRTYSGSEPPDLGTLHALPHASGNWDEDPQFAYAAGTDSSLTTFEDNDWHLTADSPAEVRQGGQDGTVAGWGFATDKDRLARTNVLDAPPDGPTNDGAAGWSMGAYEQD